MFNGFLKTLILLRLAFLPNHTEFLSMREGERNRANENNVTVL